MKPIEPGCLCVIINSVVGNNGKVVGVVRYIGRHSDPFDKESPMWETDTNVKVVYMNEDSSIMLSGWTNIIPEQHLMRIDGYEPDDVENLEERLLESVK